MNVEIATSRAIPEIVHIVLGELAKRRHAKTISAKEYEAKLQRITREEIQPRHLALRERNLPDGRTRFIIKQLESGRVCDMLEVASLASAA